ncbi:FAD:protein FMN transferase [Sporocytophaga sp.]|uniref:FAD:protein FMN transferase n=1 Tax=Sporocytophaga sp. TaxID=2231183 RepID=UPI00345BF2D6
MHKLVGTLMGNTFELSIAFEKEGLALQYLNEAVEEIRRIEGLLTTFDENSQTNLINRYAGISPVRVDEEVYNLIERSIKISELTQGAFDISYGAMDKRLWNFDLSMTTLPKKEVAAGSVHLINYKNIILNKKNRTIFLKEKGMRIGFGGIGKGYAAEMAKAFLLKKGIKSGIVNAAGDLSTWGKQPNGDPFTIGIADPQKADQLFSYLSISDLAVATSGNYEKYVVIGGKRYSHTIDPKTGYPVSGIKSVTTICPNAEIADAMATPIMVMGVHAGLHMINQIRHMACIIVDDDNIIHTSRNIKLK